MSENTFNHSLDALSLKRLEKQCRRTQEQVYRLFVDAAWKLALRLTGCEASAWDAVHDGFVRAFRQAGQLRDGGSFGFWLRRIIVNQAMDRHRIQGRESSQPPPESSESAPDPAWLDLETELARLDADDRMVLWLHDAEGMTHEEISSIAGKTVSWSKTRLSRTRARLREALNRGSLDEHTEFQARTVGHEH